ncbi:glycosyltransferase family 2 protein [Winogradskyella sp.]|nr:glycosyltransferase family 2 protein [Winogradskyella sp.]MDA8874519.1 glycosyltransferase family 2 protein [Winogradskyella sp.]
MSDLVSIIIPTYNRAHLIAETLDSIIAQTHTNWECIVVDDGSTDDTQEVLERYVKNDKRFTYIKRPEHLPKGANACRNYGFELSKGAYVNWFDSDDVMLSKKLEAQIKALLKFTNSPFCISQTQWKNKINGKDLGLRSRHLNSNNRLENYILYKSYWSILAPLWRRNFIEQNNLRFDESLHQSQEYDFHIQALDVSEDFVIVDDVLSIMYEHDTNISVDIYANNFKIESNLTVKERVTKNHLFRFTTSGQLKWLEILTLYFKALLVHKKTTYAKKAIPLIFSTLKEVDISSFRKLLFRIKIILAYISFVLTGKGYTLVKPLT